MTLRPLLSRTLRRLGFEAHYKQLSTRSWELEPACDCDRLPAIFDESDLQKIGKAAPHTTLEQQVELLRAGRVRHPARRVHLISNVSMVNGHLFTRRMVHPMAHGPLPSVGGWNVQEVRRAALGTSEYGNKYFGHWFCDDVPMSRTASELGDVYGHVNADNRLIGHQQVYADLFEWKVHLVRDAFFHELLIPDWSPPTPYQAERFQRLRQCLPVAPESRSNPGVMLLRLATGQQRVLSNEGDIAEIARARGFQVLDPLASSVSELVEACSNAQIVMGVEGSQLTHGFLPLAPGGTVLTFQPPFKFDHFWKERCDCVGARYAFIVGTQVSDAEFTVDVDRVERMLDRLQGQRA